MTPLTVTLLLLMGVFTAAIAAAIQRKRTMREGRCPHCCVRKHYCVGYADAGHSENQGEVPVRCKSCKLLFMVPG